eukprot:gene31584-60496_t
MPADALALAAAAPRRGAAADGLIGQNISLDDAYAGLPSRTRDAFASYKAPVASAFTPDTPGVVTLESWNKTVSEYFSKDGRECRDADASRRLSKPWGSGAKSYRVCFLPGADAAEADRQLSRAYLELQLLRRALSSELDGKCVFEDQHFAWVDAGGVFDPVSGTRFVGDMLDEGCVAKALRSGEEFAVSAGHLPVTLVGWPLDDAPPFSEAPFAPPVPLPHRVAAFNGANGLTHRTIQQCEADESIPRHFCKGAIVSGRGALELGSTGFTAGSSKGCYWLVSASVDPTKDTKVTDANLDALLRAAAARGVMKHAIASVAAMPEWPLNSIHVMGVNMTTVGAAALFPKWLDWTEKLHRLRAGAEGGAQQRAAGAGIVAGGLLSQVEGARSNAKLAEALHALAAAQIQQVDLQSQSYGGDAQTRQLRAQAKTTMLQRLAARLRLPLGDAKLWAHPYGWICLNVQGASVKVDFDLLAWVGNLERNYEAAPGSGYVDVLYGHAKRHGWAGLFTSCTKEAPRLNSLHEYGDADVLAPLAQRVPLDAREMEKTILRSHGPDGFVAEHTHIGCGGGRCDTRAVADDALALNLFPSKLRSRRVRVGDVGEGWRGERGSDTRCHAVSHPPPPPHPLVHTTPRSSPSHILLDFADDATSGVYELEKAPPTIGRSRDDPADTPNGWWQEVVARVERAAADATLSVTISAEAPRRKATDEPVAAKVAKVEPPPGPPPADSRFQSTQAPVTRFEVFNLLPEAQQGTLRASDLVGFHIPGFKKPMYRPEHCGKCDFFGHNHNECEGLDKALYVWRSANGATAPVSEWAQQNMSRLRPSAPPTLRGVPASQPPQPAAGARWAARRAAPLPPTSSGSGLAGAPITRSRAR